MELKEKFIHLVKILELKFDIKEKKLFEDSLIKLINEEFKNPNLIDIDSFQNKFFGLIKLFTTKTDEEIKKEAVSELKEIIQ